MKAFALGLTMSWHKVTLPFKDCFADGPGARLRDAFTTILTAHGGRPFDAALFEQNSDENESVYFYFSPAACDLAPALIKQFRGVPCSGPPFPGKIAYLAVGDARSWDLLGVNKPAGLD